MSRLSSQRARPLLVATAFLCALAAAPVSGQQQLQQQGPRSGQREQEEEGRIGGTNAARADAAGAIREALPGPSPALSPDEVVSIQLEALQHNDSPTRDHGIATTFRFASPANRVATGPLDHFSELVKNSLYRAMIDHRRVERGRMHVEGDEARQRVTVYAASGARVTYLFLLSRQHGGAYDGCWMTDGVVRIDLTGPRPDGLRSA